MGIRHKDLISINQLSVEDIQEVLAVAREMREQVRSMKQTDALKGVTVVNLFYENSTRTRSSFELAAKYQGANVLNISASSSSEQKGEGLIDTAQTINAYNPDVIVMVDEAYVDFGGESALPLIEKYDNLLVIQTYSKSRSLAGSRIGFAMGNKTLIKYLNDVKYSFNSYTMDSLTIALGTAAMKDVAYFEKTRDAIVRTREWTKEQLRELGFVFGDSKSNFIFATHPGLDMIELFEALKEEGIYVRHFSKPERISNYLRISVGTDREMETFIQFLTRYLESR